MPPKCTKCHRPSRGHSGPVDNECTLDEAGEGLGMGQYQDLSFDSEREEKDKLDEAGGGQPRPHKKIPTPRKKSDAAFALKEILVQLGNLTCNVQRLTDENKQITEVQKKLQSELTRVKSTAAAAATPNLAIRPLIPPVYSPASLNVPPVPPVDNIPPPDAAPPANMLQGTLHPGLELPIPLPNGARVSRKTYLSARAGEYVNLSEFAPNSEPSAIMESIIDETTGQLVFKSKTVKKGIDTFLAWSRAWAGYESLLVTMTASLYQTLTDYRLFVQSCDALYLWSAVSSYDQRHRHRTSMTNSLDFNNCSTDIYVSTLNANTIRPNPKSCYACGSIDHNLKDCPFQQNPNRPSSKFPKRSHPYPNTGQAKPNMNQSFTPRTDVQAFADSKPVLCFNFNNGRCNSPACWRLHQCSGCGGPEPRITCSRCTAAKG